MQKFVTVSDIHGSERDEPAVALALAFVEDFDPDVRIINGDLFDFAALRVGASEDDRRVDLDQDVEMGIDFAKRFFKRGATNVFMMGNHDKRVLDFAKQTRTAECRYFATKLWDYITSEIVTPFGAIVKPYHSVEGVFSLGNLKFLHGYSTGNAAAKQHAIAYGNVVFGHTHSITSARAPGLKYRRAFNQGCLCRLNLEYASKNLGPLQWQHGFGYGVVMADHFYLYKQASIIENKLIAATDFTSYEYELE